MKVKDVVQTCGACPSQWEAETETDHSVYIRYRWGRLTIEVCKLTGVYKYCMPSAKDWYLVFTKQIGGEFDGVISWGEVQPYVDDVILLEEYGFD